MKVTGHLCSVTYAEAADLGIDNLEHGFFAATDFVADKKPDTCPGQGAGQQTIAALDENGEPFKALVKKLVDKQGGADVDADGVRDLHARPAAAAGPRGADCRSCASSSSRTTRARSRTRTRSTRRCSRKAMALERAFARAGGLLIAGTDPTGGGGVIPGYSNQRQIELLVEAGFTPLEAIQIGTLNGAKYLGRDARIGSIAVGKQADLVVVAGNPSASIADVRKVETVFKQGVGFDPAKLIASVTGRVGLW